MVPFMETNLPIKRITLSERAQKNYQTYQFPLKYRYENQPRETRITEIFKPVPRQLQDPTEGTLGCQKKPKKFQ